MPEQKDKTFLERRRQLLRMGAAGMPMALTLRAGATEAVVSQLRCVITIPGSLKILVDEDGAAWVGDGSIKTDKKGNYKSKSISKFKSGADYEFQAGSVPASYRPDCDSGSSDDSGWGDDSGDDSSDDSCGSGDDSWAEADFDILAHLDDPVKQSYAADYIAGGGGDDSSDDHCHTQDTECYAVYSYSQGQEITPGNYTNGGTGWSIGGGSNAELYLALSLQYEQVYGEGGNWPGISCVVSVINYLP